LCREKKRKREKVLLLLDALCGAGSRAGAAINALVGIYPPCAVFLRNRFLGAFALASSAIHTTVAYFVSHKNSFKAGSLVIPVYRIFKKLSRAFFAFFAIFTILSDFDTLGV
jgi:hypothetical protein